MYKESIIINMIILNKCYNIVYQTMNQNKPEQTSMTEYIKCVRCHMKYINDDGNIKTDFGYNRLNERYKQCYKCRCQTAEYRQAHRDELKEKSKTYYNNDKEHLINMKTQYNQENVVCDVCNKSLTRNGLYRHRMSLNCKGNVNYKLYFKFNLFDLDIDNIYKLRYTMLHGDFDGAFYKFTDEERKRIIRMDYSIEIFINDQLDIKHIMMKKWGGLCEKLMNNMCQ